MNTNAFTFWLPGFPQSGIFKSWRKVVIPFGKEPEVAPVASATPDLVVIPAPVPAPVAPARPLIVARESRDFGRVLTAVFSGAIIALVAVVIMNHPWAIVPLATTSTTPPIQPGISDNGKSQGGGMVNTDVNHDGVDRGWDVWNRTGETLEIYVPNGAGGWKPVLNTDGTTRKLAPGGCQSLPCRSQNLHILFKGQTFEHRLDHAFASGEKVWYQDFIRMPSRRPVV